MIHGASDLPKMDTMGKSINLRSYRQKLNPFEGTSDPYLSISFSKYNKPRMSPLMMTSDMGSLQHSDYHRHV